MRPLLLVILIFLVPALPDPTLAQQDEAPATDGATRADSALVARLQEELNWRKVIRLRTDGTWLEIEKPSVSPLGIDYSGLNIVEPVTGTTPSMRPILLPEVLEIRVRKGNHKGGVLIGGIVTAGLGALWASELATYGSGDFEIGPGTLVGLAIFAVPGVVLGSFLGEALYTWQPVYTAPPSGSPLR